MASLPRPAGGSTAPWTAAVALGSGGIRWAPSVWRHLQAPCPSHVGESGGRTRMLPARDQHVTAARLCRRVAIRHECATVPTRAGSSRRL